MPTKAQKNDHGVNLVDAARALRQALDSHTIKDVSRTRLARHSSEVMTEMLENREYLRVQIGTQRMLLVDEDYLHRTRDLLDAVEARLDELDPVLVELRGRFDRLAGQMNKSAARQATHDALFGDDAPANLRDNYAPGRTEEPV